MPKGGRGASSKQSTAPSIPNEEESNVVFGDAKSAKKTKRATSGGDPAVNGGVGPQGGPSDGPKMPDIRMLIAGASWTGKLPVNMLSEHCQKQKWAKPEYTMVKSPGCLDDLPVANLLYRPKPRKVSPLWSYSKVRIQRPK